MKDFIKYFTFTKKSIFTVSLIALSVSIYIAIKIGFENKANIILSCILLSLTFVIYALYVIIVLAFFWLVFFRDDLSNELLTKEFIEEIQSDLTLINEFTTLNDINKAIDSMQ